MCVGGCVDVCVCVCVGGCIGECVDVCVCNILREIHSSSKLCKNKFEIPAVPVLFPNIITMMKYMLLQYLLMAAKEGTPWVYLGLSGVTLGQMFT